MRFRSYDQLRVFDVVARARNFSDAATTLNLSKGAVSYQMKRLERELGFDVFERRKQGAVLTDKGERLWRQSRSLFESIEIEIAKLRDSGDARITVAMATYFASRWLAPRLMSFTSAHPDIALQLQPTVGIVDLRAEPVDLAIRWGTGDWSDVETELLLPCPAWLVASPSLAGRIRERGLDAALPDLTLLDDDQHSAAWADWHAASGRPFQPAREHLVIPDPNVRLQAVVADQGVAFFDSLAAAELDAGKLERISGIELADYAYFLTYRRGAMAVPALRDFRDWIVAEASRAGPRV